jgi:small subunit ribosomal protein S27e
MIESKVKSKFIRLKCADCGNEQIVFNKPSTLVTCFVCGTILAKPVGKKATFRGKIVEVLS